MGNGANRPEQRGNAKRQAVRWLLVISRSRPFPCGPTVSPLTMDVSHSPGRPDRVNLRPASAVHTKHTRRSEKRDMDGHTLELLQFDRVRELAAGYSACSLGKDLARQLE